MSIGNVAKKEMEDFLNKTYYIPNYQREYSWEDDELTDFLSDMESILDSNQKHFFGQIVVHDDQGANKKYIIDGQQRTITSVIFLRALSILYKNEFSNNSEALSYREKGIKKSYKIEGIIGAYGDDSDEEEPIRLILGEGDNKFFVEEVFKKDTPKSEKVKKKSQERIRKAFIKFLAYLKAKVDEKSSIEEKFKCLNNYFEAFTKRFEIMYMEATELDEAFVIFETLNARGKELETSDLLKNYIFSKADKDSIVSYQELWNTMTDDLDKIDLTVYIRHFWNSSNELTRMNTLYRKIVSNTKTVEEAKGLLKNLAGYAAIYHDLRFPTSASVIEDDTLIQHLENLSILNAKTFTPLILAMYQTNKKEDGLKYTEKDISKVANTIENYVFRNATICKRTANKTEKFMGETALKIYRGEITTVEEVCKAIEKGMVTDEEFKAAFKEWSSKNKTIIRYILRKLNYEMNETHETVITKDNNKVQLEHIMPINNSKWKIDDEIHSEYLWRLGNLTLLSGKINAEASNNPFKLKVDSYKTSQIDLNKTIWKDSRGKERKKWTEGDIQDRQNLFAELAIKAWPRK